MALRSIDGKTVQFATLKSKFIFDHEITKLVRQASDPRMIVFGLFRGAPGAINQLPFTLQHLPRLANGGVALILVNDLAGNREQRLIRCRSDQWRQQTDDEKE